MARSERKKPYSVEIPYFNQSFKVLSTNPETLPGKLMKLDMTRMLRGRSMEGNLLIKKEGDKLVSEFIALKVLHSYIKRMMRKNISWVEDSFVVKTKDLQLRIKPFMITRKRVHRSLRKELRERTKEIITKTITEMPSAEVFEAVIKGALQKDLMSKLKKVYPLAFFEIRVLKIERPKHQD